MGQYLRAPYTQSTFQSGFAPLDFLRIAALYLAANVGDPYRGRDPGSERAFRKDAG